jgi:hypothetical protein
LQGVEIDSAFLVDSVAGELSEVAAHAPGDSGAAARSALH